MIAGILHESYPGERRVATVPAVVPSLKKAGLEVLIEAGAGAAAGFPDDEYAAKEASLAGREQVLAEAEVLLSVRSLGPHAGGAGPECGRLRPGQIVVGMLDPLGSPETARALAERGVTAYAMELIPRTTRAQSMDVLSSMATIAGYKAVLLAADALPRLFPMLMTAAGTVTPARVLVVGAGVAGLQAIATARRLGAVVEAYDVRPAVKEQIESLGAKFVELPLETASAQDAGGYAKAQSDDFLKRQRELMGRVVGASDVVITTAAVPGQRAPLLVTREMLHGMHPGSVVVDLAAETGGNCEATRPGEETLEHGVRVLGPLNVGASIPYHASQLYARNLANFLAHAAKNGWREAAPQDEIVRETRVAHAGQVVHPRLRQKLGLAEAVPATA
jgi:NAD(P) transhydrogenase subunit alpha